MQKQLAGITFIRNSIQYDYHIRETILSLIECTDHVFVVDAGSDDGTTDILTELFREHREKLTVIFCQQSEWHEQKGREKLSYFTNIAIKQAQDGYSHVFYCQADEIIPEASYPFLRALLEMYPDEEAFLTPRINLWGDSQHYLTCSHDRMPCSTQVIRLAKSHCRAVGDAESLDGQCKWLVDEIPLFHTGFIRNKYKMIGKVRNMVENVFGMGPDKALDSMTDGWNPFVSHSREDVSPHGRKLPMLIQEWAKERDRINAEKPEQPNERAGR